MIKTISASRSPHYPEVGGKISECHYDFLRRTGAKEAKIRAVNGIKCANNDFNNAWYSIAGVSERSIRCSVLQGCILLRPHAMNAADGGSV